MRNTLLSLAFIIISTSLSLAQNQIVVTVNSVSVNNGNIMVALYNSEDSFIDTSFKEKKVASNSDVVELIFDDIPNGNYAISLFQDENDDKKLTIGMFGPKEPYGFSNNAKGSFGPAKFKDAKFEVKDGDVKIEIDLD